MLRDKIPRRKKGRRGAEEREEEEEEREKRKVQDNQNLEVEIMTVPGFLGELGRGLKGKSK